MKLLCTLNLVAGVQSCAVSGTVDTGRLVIVLINLR